MGGSFSRKCARKYLLLKWWGLKVFVVYKYMKIVLISLIFVIQLLLNLLHLSPAFTNVYTTESPF